MAATQDQGIDWNKVAEELGVSVPKLHQQAAQAHAMTGESVKELLTNAVRSAGTDATQGQLRAGAEQSEDYTPAEWAKLSPEQKAQNVESYVQDSSTVFDPGTANRAAEAVKTKGASVAPKKKQEKQAAPEDTTESELQSAEQAIAGQGQEMVDLNTNMTNEISGAMTGTSNQLQGLDPAMAGALDAYNKAYAQGEGFNSAAYDFSGKANEQALAAAPETDYLQLLSQIGSNYYKQIPANLASQLPVPLAYALSQAGVQGITAPKGGWPKSLTGGQPTSDVAQGLTALGSTPANTPALNTPPSSGNPNQAGS